jgi:hypothetical protein
VDHEIWHHERGIGLLFTFLFYTIQYVPHRQATVLAQGESSTLPVVHQARVLERNHLTAVIGGGGAGQGLSMCQCCALNWAHGAARCLAVRVYNTPAPCSMSSQHLAVIVLCPIVIAYLEGVTRDL